MKWILNGAAMYNLKPAVKKKWLKALRSGEFQQGRGRLRDWKEDGSRCYCCLGVLAEITKSEKHTGRCDAALNGVNLLSGAMAEFAGFGSDISPSVPVAIARKHIKDEKMVNLFDSMERDSEQVELWKLNDRYRIDFAGLADIIEEAF